LIAPEAGEAGGGAEFKHFRPLLARNGERSLIVRFGGGRIAAGCGRDERAGTCDQKNR